MRLSVELEHVPAHHKGPALGCTSQAERRRVKLSAVFNLVPWLLGRVVRRRGQARPRDRKSEVGLTVESEQGVVEGHIEPNRNEVRDCCHACQLIRLDLLQSAGGSNRCRPVR